MYKYYYCVPIDCQRPYHAECTGSRLITEVKQHRARLVLAWVTGWEYRVLLASIFLDGGLDSSNIAPFY